MYNRTDLANIVRRRGYKRIRELLANTPKGEVNGLNEEDSLAEGKNAVSGVASLRTGHICFFLSCTFYLFFRPRFHCY